MRRRFADELAKELDALLFASPSHRTRERVADALATLDRGQQDEVLRWVQVIAQTSPELAWNVCARAPSLFTRAGGLSTDQFAVWVQAILAHRDGNSGARDWLDDIEGFLDHHHDSARLDFEQIARRLQLFLRGIGGEGLSVQSLPANEMAAWTDGELILLPAQLTGHSSQADSWRHYQALTLLLWAQQRFGSLALANDELLSTYKDSAALIWFERLERVRLRAKLIAEFPGLAAILPNDSVIPESAQTTLAQPEASAADSLRLLPEILHGGLTLPAQPELRIDFSAVRARLASTTACATTNTRRLANVFRGDGKAGKSGERHGESLDATVAGESDSLEGSTDAQRGDAEPATAAKPASPPPPDGRLMPAGHGRWQATRTHDEAVPQAPAETCAWRYDEWDYQRGAYRRDWCHVFEREGVAGDIDWVSATTACHAQAIRQIRRRFESLRGEDRWQRRQMDGSELDLDAWVDALADARSGNETEPALFCRRTPQERSLAVIFMVDMSGSTKGWVNEAERESLVMLCEAIEALGDAYAIYGFSGWTHQRCDIYRIKGFAETYDTPVKARIAGIEACDYTRMGPAIRHLSQRIKQRSEKHKLLVTISDGRPDDFGDLYRGRYGIEDTRRALQEARRAGIRSYCVTVDRHAADYLPQLYGPAHYSVLAEAKALPLRIAQVYRRLVA